MQTKKHSHYETITNQVVGIVMGWSIVYFLFPVMGVIVTVEQTTLSTAVFFVSSYSRAYFIRRIFNEKRRD